MLELSWLYAPAKALSGKVQLPRPHLCILPFTCSLSPTKLPFIDQCPFPKIFNASSFSVLATCGRRPFVVFWRLVPSIDKVTLNLSQSISFASARFVPASQVFPQTPCLSPVLLLWKCVSPRDGRSTRGARRPAVHRHSQWFKWVPRLVKSAARSSTLLRGGFYLRTSLLLRDAAVEVKQPKA